MRQEEIMYKEGQASTGNGATLPSNNNGSGWDKYAIIVAVIAAGIAIAFII